MQKAAYDLRISDWSSDVCSSDLQGRISKVALDGKVLEERFLPPAGQTLDKPKGIWVAGNRLWVTDIDTLWVFDTMTKEGRSVELPGSQFANDPTIVGEAVFVSDNRRDQLYRVTPADFRAPGVLPEVTPNNGAQALNPHRPQ